MEPAVHTIRHQENRCRLFIGRFHGRNAKGWRSGDMQKQFDYFYSDQELAEWTRSIKTQMSKAQKGAMFFNNHVQGQAPRNALSLISLLGLS